MPVTLTRPVPYGTSYPASFSTNAGAGGEIIVASDSFNRTASDSLGNTDSYAGGTAHAWNEWNGNWRIVDDDDPAGTFLYADGVQPALPRYICNIDTGFSDGLIRAVVYGSGSQTIGLSCRHTTGGGAGGYMCGLKVSTNEFRIFRYTGAANNVLATSNPSPVLQANLGYTMELEARGQNFTARLYGHGVNTEITASASVNQFVTNWGTWCVIETANTYIDDWRVYR